MKNHKVSRRALIKSSVFGLMTVSIPSIVYARGATQMKDPMLFHRYPSIDDELVAEVVGASHFDLEKVKEMVSKRPELARATWDWAFGDWETAIGAASHTGRRDIADFLISKGARPDIFTFAMYGNYEVVKYMIEEMPGIQSLPGPHGISLLQHVKAGLRSKELTEKQKSNSNKLISYLEKLGGADIQEPHIEMSDAEKEKYLGDYKYGEGETDGFSVKLNMRKMISLGKLGKFGGALFQKSPNVFSYNGVSSVEISFEVVEDKVLSLTVTEPNLQLKAIKVI